MTPVMTDFESLVILSSETSKPKTTSKFAGINYDINQNFGEILAAERVTFHKSRRILMVYVIYFEIKLPIKQNIIQ